MSVLTLFESRYTSQGRYSIGNVDKTAAASMSMLTLFESRYTLKERYNIGNVGQTASMSMNQAIHYTTDLWCISHGKKQFHKLLQKTFGAKIMFVCKCALEPLPTFHKVSFQVSFGN